MGGVSFLILGIIVVNVAWRVWRSMQRRTEAVWAEAAQRLGLEYEPGRAGVRALFFDDEDAHHRLRGRIDGVPVAVDSFFQRRGNNRRLYTGYRVAYPSLGLGLGIRRARFMSRLMTRFGAQDIEVGDAEFDREFIITGSDDRKVAAFLDPSRRLALTRLLVEYPDAQITDRWIRCATQGLERRPNQITRTVRLLVDAGRALAGQADRPIDRALKTQRAGNLGEAAELAREAARGTADPETLRTEAEVLYAAGRYEEAAEEFARLEELEPDDPVAAQWRERAEERRARPAAAPAPAPDPVPEPDIDLDPDVRSTEDGPAAAEVAEALFDPKHLSFETTRIFEERYEGRRVAWQGPLVRVSSYRSDLDFRDGPGTKAVVRVHRLANDLYAGRDVEAVVELPPEAIDELRDRRGELVSFRGRLTKCDPLMRNLFVEAGRLG